MDPSRNVGVGGGNGDAPEDKNLQSPNRSVGDIHPFIKLLQVDVVADELVRYLSFNDLKALTQVSKDCMIAIRKTTTFSGWTSFRIPNDDEESQKIIKGDTFPWKHVSIDISKVQIESIDLISDILESAESISISCGGSAMINDAAYYLNEILRRTNNLRELELSFDILTNDLLDLFPSFESVITNLDGLVFRTSCWTTHKLWQKFLDQNLSQIPLFPLHLKKFVFGWGKFDVELFLHVASIIQVSQATLEHLELQGNAWKLDEMKSIRCPKLKRLVLSGSPRTKKENKIFGEVIEAFIKNQPLLEELAIGMIEFPYKLLLSMQPRLTNLRKFFIKAQCFEGTSEPISWAFMGTMSKLKKVYIRKPDGFWDATSFNIYGWGEDIIKQLPLSTSTISVQGLCPFWKINNAEQRGYEPNIGTLVSRFEHLTALSLIKSNGAMNDAGLQTLIQTCPRLTKLAFSHCPDVSDFGISGIRNSEVEGEAPQNSGISLANLKGLTYLKIWGCARVTPDCILQVVKLVHLRRLDFWTEIPTRLDKEFIFQILRQNPCLEKIGPRMTNLIQISDEFEDEVKELNPRITLLYTPEDEEAGPNSDP